MLKDIIDYEKKLIADREQLLKLTEEYQGESDEVIQDKLQFFQNELTHMNYQYEMLKKRVELNSCKRMETQSELMPQMQSQSEPNLVSQPEFRMESQPEPQVAKQPEKKSTNLEKAVGSSLMGILASGLIFISLILFATLFLPYMGNEVKLFSCYLVSFILIGVALFKLRKNAENKFYLALAGCGVGALYITLLLTNIYFKYIEDIPLFVLITVWVAFVCYLSKVKNKVFHIIGQLGVTISIIFGSILCVETRDILKFMSLSIFYIFAFGALYVTHWDKEVARNKAANIFGCINLILLCLASVSIIENPHDPYYLFMMVIVLAHLIALFIGRWEKAKVSYGVFVSIYAFIMSLFALGFAEKVETEGIIFYLIAIAMIFLVEFKKKAYHAGEAFCQIAMILQAWWGLSMYYAVYEHGYVWLLVLPVVTLGFLRRNMICRYAGLVLLGAYLFGYTPGIEQFVVGFITLIIIYVLLWWKKEEYSFVFKMALHVLGVIFFLTAGMELLSEFIESYQTQNAVTFIAIAIYNLVMAKSCFGKNFKTGEAENTVCYDIINLILMAAGLVLINENTVVHIPVILVTLVIFLMNSKNLLDKYQHIYAGIYVGLKFTVLLIVILNSFDAANYVISSICILLAIACIIFGFVQEYKSLRIYGLLLSMISVFKLVMVDIHYDNTLGNAISFFISGVLCFAISMIYNYIDKRVIEKKEE